MKWIPRRSSPALLMPLFLGFAMIPPPAVAAVTGHPIRFMGRTIAPPASPEAQEMIERIRNARTRTAQPTAARPVEVAANPPGSRFDAWIGNGVRVTTGSLAQLYPALVADGAGGAYATWLDFRVGLPYGYPDIYANRLDPNGDFPSGWNTLGLQVVLRDSIPINPQIDTDGAGGAFVALSEYFQGMTAYQDVYLQRLLPGGTIGVGWPAAGKKFNLGGNYGHVIKADGQGGLFVGWILPSLDPRILRVNSNGDPATGWSATGMDLPSSSSSILSDLAADGTGGFYYAWASLDTVLCSRYAADGTLAPGWAAGGKVLAVGVIGVDDLSIARLTSGDAMVFWSDYRTFDLDLYAVRVGAGGSFPAPWAVNGVPVCTEIGSLSDPFAVPDLSGGAIAAWSDDRDPSNRAIYAQRITSGGGLAAGWALDGMQLCAPRPSKIPGAVVGDGANGILAAWSDDPSGNFDVYAQRLVADGTRAPGFPVGGALVCNAPDDQSSGLVMTTDNASGAILAWEDLRNSGITQVYAARVLANGTVAAQASLAEATASPDAIRLHWWSPDGIRFAARLERETGGAGFERLADLRAEASGHLRYEDRDVRAGERYRYRLVTGDGATRRVFGEVTLQVPEGLSLAIEPARPNPSAGPLTLTFTLPSDEPARLELFDVGGRRVFARDVGASGAGRHLLRVGEGLAPGIYAVRLAQGGRGVSGRVVVTE
jgi:hypothetical protein